MLVPDQALTNHANTVLETTVFFIIPIVLVLTGAVPFHFRHVLLGASTIGCTAVYLHRSQKPSITVSKQSTAWLAPLLVTLTFIAAVTSFNPSYQPRLFLYAVLVSAPQEFLFRAYLQKRLTQTYNASLSITMSSLIFAVAHLIYAEPTQMLLTTFLFSLIIGITYHYDDNILLATTVHAVANYLAINTCLIAIPGTC